MTRAYDPPGFLQSSRCLVLVAGQCLGTVQPVRITFIRIACQQLWRETVVAEVPVTVAERLLLDATGVPAVRDPRHDSDPNVAAPEQTPG